MRTEKFNPYEHLTICQNQTGDLIMEPVEQNGMPVLIEDDGGCLKLVQMPKMYLNRFALTEWFWKEYPDGGITDELMPGCEWNGERFVYSDELTVKVTLFSDREKKTVLSTSYGIVKRSAAQDDSKDVLPFAAEFQGKDGPYRLAYYIALKTAMERAGFIYESDYDVLKEHLPFFLESAEAGPVAKWIPLDKKKVLSEKKEKLKTSKEKSVNLSPAEEPAKKETPAIPVAPVASGKAAPKDALAFIAEMNASLGKPEEPDSEPEWLREPSKDDGKSEEDSVDAAREVIYHVIPGGLQNERLALMEGKRLGDLDAKTINFIATRPAMEGQLTTETISAAKVLAGIL